MVTLSRALEGDPSPIPETEHRGSSGCGFGARSLSASVCVCPVPVPLQLPPLRCWSHSQQECLLVHPGSPRIYRAHDGGSAAWVRSWLAERVRQPLGMVDQFIGIPDVSQAKPEEDPLLVGEAAITVLEVPGCGGRSLLGQWFAHSVFSGYLSTT